MMIPNPNSGTSTLSDEDLNTLIQHLQSGELDAQRQAAIALGNQADDRLIPVLMQALHHADSTVRANVIGGLGTNRASEAVDALIGILHHDDNEIVRERAVTALAQIGTDDVILPLLDAIDDKSTFVRNRAIYVLGASGDLQAIDALIEALDHQVSSTQGVAAWALGAIGDQRALTPLIGLLSEKQADVRGNAAWALGELGDGQAIDALLPMIRDKDAQVRGKVAWALGSLGEATGDVRMVKPLIDLLDDFTEVKGQSAHFFVAQYAAEALAQIGSDVANLAVQAWRPRAEKELIPYQVRDMFQYLRHEDRNERQAAMEYLAGLGGDVLPHIIKGLKHQHARIRQGCAQILGMLAESTGADAQAVEALIHALADRDSGVWSQATASLAKIGLITTDALYRAQNDGNRRTLLGVNIALWRSNRDENAFPIVLQAVQDDDELVRSSAITGLWLQSDARAVATLQIQLGAEEEAVLAQYIVQALHATGTEAAHATIRHWLAQQADDTHDEPS